MKNELNVKKFWELLRKYLPLKKNIGILLFLIFSQVFCTLYMPIAVMNTIDISSGNYYEWKKICWIAFIILLQVIFSVGVLYLMSWMAHKLLCNCVMIYGVKFCIYQLNISIEQKQAK